MSGSVVVRTQSVGGADKGTSASAQLPFLYGFPFFTSVGYLALTLLWDVSYLICSVGDERGDHIWTRLVSLMRRRRLTRSLLDTTSFGRTGFKSMEQRC